LIRNKKKPNTEPALVKNGIDTEPVLIKAGTDKELIRNKKWRITTTILK